MATSMKYLEPRSFEWLKNNIKTVHDEKPNTITLNEKQFEKVIRATLLRPSHIVTQVRAGLCAIMYAMKGKISAGQTLMRTLLFSPSDSYAMDMGVKAAEIIKSDDPFTKLKFDLRVSTGDIDVLLSNAVERMKFKDPTDNESLSITNDLDSFSEWVMNTKILNTDEEGDFGNFCDLLRLNVKNGVTLLALKGMFLFCLSVGAKGDEAQERAINMKMLISLRGYTKSRLDIGDTKAYYKDHSPPNAKLWKFLSKIRSLTQDDRGLQIMFGLMACAKAAGLVAGGSISQWISAATLRSQGNGTVLGNLMESTAEELGINEIRLANILSESLNKPIRQSAIKYLELLRYRDVFGSMVEFQALLLGPNSTGFGYGGNVDFGYLSLLLNHSDNTNKFNMAQKTMFETNFPQKKSTLGRYAVTLRSKVEAILRMESKQKLLKDRYTEDLLAYQTHMSGSVFQKIVDEEMGAQLIATLKKARDEEVVVEDGREASRSYTKLAEDDEDDGFDSDDEEDKKKSESSGYESSKNVRFSDSKSDASEETKPDGGSDLFSDMNL